MALKVEVETAPESGVWNDYTSLVQRPTLSVVTRGGADAGTSVAVLRDAAGTATILPEAGWRVSDGSTVIFRGKVKKRSKTERPTQTRYKWYAITAQDATCLLTDDIVDTGGLRTTVENDKARIEWLVNTYGTKGVTVGSTVQAVLGSNMPGEQDFTGLNLYEAISEVTKLSGGSIYVDTNLALHHYATENDPAPFNLSDNPNGSTTFGYQGFDAPDDSVELTNAVYVIGAEGVGEWVPAVGTWPTASQSTYGRRESSFTDATLLDSAARVAAGNAILAKYDQPRGPIRVKVFKPGLRAGMVVQITNSLWGLSAVSYRIEQVVASVHARSEFVYDVTLQDAPITLQNYLTEKLTTINRDVKRSTNVAVDYAAQFLIGRVKVVNSLPTLPDANYPIGMQVFLTTDEKMYRNPDDVAWTAAIYLADGLGAITSTQIADAAISTPKLLAGSVDTTALAAGAVTSDQIAANAIVAGKVAAGAIGAEALAAQIVLADKLLTTGLSGARVEMDDAGIRNYNASEQVMVKIPTDGTPVRVVGEVEASSLVSTVSAELRGTNSLAAGSVSTLASAVTNPTSPPGIDVSVPSLTLGTSPPQPGAGIVYDANGGAGGTTPTYWIGGNPTVGNLLDLAYEYRASDGALLRTHRKTGTTYQTTTQVGSTSHVSDSAQAREQTGNQVATPLTVPAGLTNPKVTKIRFYAAGYNGGTPTVWGCVYDTSNNDLGDTVSATLTARAFNNGNSDLYELTMTSPLAVTAGTTYRVGWYQTSNEGIQWDRDDGSSKTQYRGTGGAGNLTIAETLTANKPNVSMTVEYTVDGSVEGNVGTIIGVARQGSYIWLLDSNGWLYRYVQSTLAYVDKFDLSAYVTGTKANAGLYFNGTHLIITTATGVTASEQVKLVKVSTAGAYVSAHATTGQTVNGATAVLRGGYGDGSWHVVAASGSVNGALIYNASTYAYLNDSVYGLAAEMSGGLSAGSSGWGVGWSATNPSKVWLYTSWDWSTQSSIYWVCYTWYDITGTTHETAVSPRQSVTLGRRRQMAVSNPAIPTGGTDWPDRVRIYMARGSSDPGGANYALQVTDALTSRILSTYATGGAANPTSNSFPAGSAAQMKSAEDTGWSLWGNGNMSVGGLYLGARHIALGTGTGPYYFADGDLPRQGGAILVDDGDTGIGFVYWYRDGTYNRCTGFGSAGEGIATAYTFRGANFSPGTNGFSWFVESNNAGARLGVQNNAGYGRHFNLFILSELEV